MSKVNKGEKCPKEKKNSWKIVELLMQNAIKNKIEQRKGYKTKQKKEEENN